MKNLNGLNLGSMPFSRLSAVITKSSIAAGRLQLLSCEGWLARYRTGLSNFEPSLCQHNSDIEISRPEIRTKSRGRSEGKRNFTLQRPIDLSLSGGSVAALPKT